ncbi:MAG: hypothetical protein RR911_00140 [Oscillospiraceae bacterium]
MKKIIHIMLCLLILFSLSSCGNTVKINHPYTQEYIAGEKNIKGNVDIDKFAKIDVAFEIGANSDGYAVFKDPQKAFEVFIEKYADGIKLIKKEYNLSKISQNNYNDYGVYGWQVTTGTKMEQEQARFVSGFIDIYKNSY